jgi:hypothetical protein
LKEEELKGGKDFVSFFPFSNKDIFVGNWASAETEKERKLGRVAVQVIAF